MENSLISDDPSGEGNYFHSFPNKARLLGVVVETIQAFYPGTCLKSQFTLVHMTHRMTLSTNVRIS